MTNKLTFTIEFGNYACKHFVDMHRDFDICHFHLVFSVIIIYNLFIYLFFCLEFFFSRVAENVISQIYRTAFWLHVCPKVPSRPLPLCILPPPPTQYYILSKKIMLTLEISMAIWSILRIGKNKRPND